MAKVIPIGAFANKIAAMGGKMEQAALTGVRSAALRLQVMAVEEIKNTKPHPPEDTGELVRSAKTTPIPNGAVVSFDAPHAPFMEYGTRPHFPPMQPIIDWVLRKGLADTEEEAQVVALAVCRKIAARGIEPRFYLKKAISDFRRKKIVAQEIKAELEAMDL